MSEKTKNDQIATDKLPILDPATLSEMNEMAANGGPRAMVAAREAVVDILELDSPKAEFATRGPEGELKRTTVLDIGAAATGRNTVAIASYDQVLDDVRVPDHR